MEDIIKVIDILIKIKNTRQKSKKIDIVLDNKDNKMLCNALNYLYSPFDNCFNINIDDIKNNYYKIFITRYINKEIKLGISSLSINKLIPNYIVEANLMQYEDYINNIDYLKSKEFMLFYKPKGLRIICLIENNVPVLYTEDFKKIDGLDYIKDELVLLPDGVYDGFISNDNKNSKDILKLLNKKDIDINFKLLIFDYISSTEDFKNNISKTISYSRKTLLQNILDSYNFTNIEYINILYKGCDLNVIDLAIRKAKKNNMDGIMINTSNSYYEYKKTNNLLYLGVE